MSGVGIGGHRRTADNRLPSTTVPGRLGTGTPEQQSGTKLSAARATSGAVAGLV